MRLLLFFVTILALALTGCQGDRAHSGTPSDPNEQQGNPEAKPEKSVKTVSNGEPAGNKASKDPHTSTPDNTAGQPQKK